MMASTLSSSLGFDFASAPWTERPCQGEAAASPSAIASNRRTMKDLLREYDTRDRLFPGDELMWTRRTFLQGTSLLGATAVAAKFNGVAEVHAASAAVADRSPD